MSILILGDCHGAWPRLVDAISYGVERFGATSVIQIGDFGFRADQFLALQNELTKAPFPVHVHVIDGNHEDHDWLWKKAETGAFPIWASKYNLFAHRRGDTAVIESLRVGFLGGALNTEGCQSGTSADGNSNWVTDQDADLASEAFNLADVELVVTHSCPPSIGIGMRGQDGLVESTNCCGETECFDRGPIDDTGEPGLRRLWLRLKHHPWTWVFGHFHNHRDAWSGGTAFHCVGSVDGSDGRGRPLGYIIDTKIGSRTAVDL